MHVRPRHQTQAGTALVFSLLILLIMTIIGVATLSSTQMQERMAGNVSVQSQAFEAASAGVSDALRFGMNQFYGDPDATAPDPPLGERRCTVDRIPTDWRNTDGTSDPEYGSWNPLSLLAGSQQTVAMDYQLRAECFQDPGLTSAPLAEGYVTSRGRVTANGNELATREVEVRVADFRIDGLSALRPQGNATVNYVAANSQNYFISGNGGPAISASNQDNADTIVSAIESAGNGTRLSNYDGGVAASQYKPPFNEAWQLARFALEIKAFLEFHGLESTDLPDATLSGAQCDLLELPPPEEIQRNMGLVRPAGTTLNVSGGESFQGITYVEGDLQMKGNAEGSGMVIVEGDVEWAGTDQFNGLVITLGGDLKISGGGRAETNGMLYVANLDLVELSALYENYSVDSDGEATTIRALAENLAADNTTANWGKILDAIDALGNPDPDGDGISDNLESTAYSSLYASATDGFGETSVTFTGGGGHRITYDCESFDASRRFLEACGQLDPDTIDGDDTADGIEGFFYDGLADPWADPRCDTPGEGGTIQALRSWRENLGWRELLDIAG